jgi:hypothetical protein
MIGRGKINRELQKFPKGVSIVYLGFQFGIGIDAEPLLEEKAFEKNKRGIGFISFKAFADGIVSEKDRFDGFPIGDGVNLFHSLDGPIPFAGVKKGNVGKGQIGIDFFKAHSSSRQVDLQELWQKKQGMSS